jgi:signal transduction histidine kinase
VKTISRDSTGELSAKLETALQAQLDALENNSEPRVKRLVNELSHLTDDTSGLLVLSEQAEELRLVKERASFLVEMAQIGLILEVANHEHEKQVGSIRDAIEFLDKNVSTEARSVLSTLSDSFEIIDTRIRLFDPLVRRKTPASDRLSGEEIKVFLEQRFPDEFSQKDFVAVTPSFQKVVFTHVKRPVMLGAIHNIFHNALYWCRKSPHQAQIRLSAAGQQITISDSGPGVSPRDSKRIFEPGFSRRPYGRGLGLYVAREALRGIGFDLNCPPQPELGALSGANFVISPKNDAE